MENEKKLEKETLCKLSEKEETLSIEEIEQVEGGVSALAFDSEENLLGDTNYALCGGNGYCPIKPSDR